MEYLQRCEEEERLAFQASRYRRRIALPPLAKPEELFDQHRELLGPLMDFVAERGRLPADDEIGNAAALRDALGSIPRAFRVIESATGKDRWEEITGERAQDTLIYLGLSRFDGRPNYSALPRPLQLDVKSFFSSYSRACELADALLFSVGDRSVIDEACRASEIGKLTPDALYVHESATDYLSPVLRLFEGCARGYIGQVEGANMVKLSREEPRVSYLSYPDFEDDPHPALAFSLGVHLQTFRVRLRDYSTYRNHPILHRKETFLHTDHPLHAKFARLTRIEEHKGLFENARYIGTREGWERALDAKGLYLKGHRLLKV